MRKRHESVINSVMNSKCLGTTLHDEAHGAFMALSLYTSTSEDEVRPL